MTTQLFDSMNSIHKFYAHLWSDSPLSLFFVHNLLINKMALSEDERRSIPSREVVFPLRKVLTTAAISILFVSFVLLLQSYLTERFLKPSNVSF